MDFEALKKVRFYMEFPFFCTFHGKKNVIMNK